MRRRKLDVSGSIGRKDVAGSLGLRPLRLAMLAALPALALGACGTTGSGTAGSEATNGVGPVSQTEKSITQRLLFANTKLPEQKAAETNYGCPSANILDGTAAYRVGDAGSARGVSHQASIHDLARECHAQGGMMHIKVGIQGRLILGDSGKPGTFTVPVRVAVRSNGQTVYTKLLATPVTIPADDTQSAFVVIDDAINLPITAEDPADAYTVLVGLDPQGARAAKPRKKRRR
jgi:hypothetical protein